MTHDTFNSFLHSAGLKVTSGRLALLEVLHKSKKPQSIAKVMSALNKKINRVTAYRALDALEKAGIVRTVNLGHSHADYELALDDHHHIVCTACGRIEDFGDCGLDRLARKVANDSKDFARVDRHSLELFGVCKTCTTKEAVDSRRKKEYN